MALVKDLYDASPGTRDFLHARVRDEAGDGTAVERYRRVIVEQFFPSRGFGKLKLAEVCKAIRDYRKATGNLAGTIDLMLTYVENGTQFTREFGDINEAYYNSLESVLHEMTQLLRKDDPSLYQESGIGFSAWKITSTTSGGAMEIIFGTRSTYSKRSWEGNDTALH